MEARRLEVAGLPDAVRALETTASVIAALVPLEGRDTTIDRLIVEIADDRDRLLTAILRGDAPPRRPVLR